MCVRIPGLLDAEAAKLALPVLASTSDEIWMKLMKYLDHPWSSMIQYSLTVYSNIMQSFNITNKYHMIYHPIKSSNKYHPRSWNPMSCPISCSVNASKEWQHQRLAQQHLTLAVQQADGMPGTGPQPGKDIFGLGALNSSKIQEGGFQWCFYISPIINFSPTA